MKRFLAIIFLLVQMGLMAQVQEPIKWKFGHSRIDEENVMLYFTAVLERGWHLYDIQTSAESPVFPTQFAFDKKEGVTLDGDVVSMDKPQMVFDRNFDAVVSYYDDSVTFIQKVKAPGEFSVSGNVRFMVCNDQTCLAPTSESFNITNGATTEIVSAFPVVGVSGGLQDRVVLPTWQPDNDVLLFDDDRGEIKPSYVGTFVDGFLAGLLALLTPCVWPIIPLTVSFFIKREKGKREALFYGLSIVLIYTLLGMLVTYLFGANVLNAISTSAVFDVSCFLLLVFFAASFFGMFEITLPSSWSTKLDARAEKTGGIVGIFLMAATLAIVSFSCTGPIVGTLLVSESVGGAFWAPFVGMLAFSLALAIPFTLFALFPQWLNTLPKSGAWMNVVKVSLGFFELAFSLKFLSVADLAYGWHILDREVFIALWVALSVLLSFYYLGKIRFAFDEEVKTVSFIRFLMALMPLAFAVYMLPGLWGAPLKAVSAFVPPISTQDFNLNQQNGLVFNDYDEGMKYAEQHSKKVLLDFSGYGCVNCRKMESTVLTDAEVKNVIDNNYVQIVLFVDDRTPLIRNLEIVEKGETKTLKTTGDLWSYLQRFKFGANAQPYYVILDAGGKLLEKPYSYNEDTQKFLEFLKRPLLD